MSSSSTFYLRKPADSAENKQLGRRLASEKSMPELGKLLDSNGVVPIAVHLAYHYYAGRKSIRRDPLEAWEKRTVAILNNPDLFKKTFFIEAGKDLGAHFERHGSKLPDDAKVYASWSGSVDLIGLEGRVQIEAALGDEKTRGVFLFGIYLENCLAICKNSLSAILDRLGRKDVFIVTNKLVTAWSFPFNGDE